MKLLKTASLLLFFALSAKGQKDIFYWTDTSTAYINHRIVNMVEYRKNLFILSKSLDADLDHPHPSFSRVSLQGRVQNFTVYNNVNDIYELNALVVQPNDEIRIYGTSIYKRKFVPYINAVTQNGVMSGHGSVMVGVPHFVGDAQQVSPGECVWAISIQDSSTNRYNANVFRVDMYNNDKIAWKAMLTSEYNEECTRLAVLPDTSVLLLCKRFTDETSTRWIPVIYKMDPKGALLWSRELPDYSGFAVQNFAADRNNIYYSCSMGNEKAGSNSGNILKLNQHGIIVNRVSIDEINPNGILVLKSGKILLYGSVYKTEGVLFIKKGKVFLFDDNLTKIKERTLGEMDKPDFELPGWSAAMKPTSSDILTAIQLTDGRVALGGRVYMPLHTAPNAILLAPRTNRNLLIYAGDDGIW